MANLEKFKGLADAIITLPMVLPPTVVGFFLILFFGKRSFIGKFLLQFDIFLVVSLPLMYRTTRGAFEQLDRNIINAAQTLGVSEWKIFWKIILPNTRFGILAGTVLAFTRALGEFGATIMFAGNIPGVTQIMSTAIYSAVQANDYDLVFQWTMALVIFYLVFMVLLNGFLKNPVTNN